MFRPELTSLLTGKKVFVHPFKVETSLGVNTSAELLLLSSYITDYIFLLIKFK